MSTHANEIVDFESMIALDNPIKSNMVPRWQRKQAQAEKADRFISNRELSHNNFIDENVSIAGEGAEDSSDYQKLLQHVVLEQGEGAQESRILACRNKAPAPRDGYQNSMKVLYSQQIGKKEVAKPTRHIPSAPLRILDAPDLIDDYYLNLLSWSSTNVLAVALAQCTYLWDATSGTIKELMSVDNDPNDYISAVSWIQNSGSHIAIGTASNAVQLWDVQAGKQVRSMDGHSGRVGALAWNGHILSSGSKDTTIIHHDVRIQNHAIAILSHHQQEVCGLAWSPDGAYLASGANDNALCIWDNVSSQPKHVMNEHQAAVKALAWSPHERNLLASGG
eukprot:gene37616-49253_t